MSLFNSTKAAAVMAIAMGLCLAQGIYAQDGKRIYAGVRLGGSVGMSSLKDEEEKKYYDESKDDKWVKSNGYFDVAPFISLQLADKFALQTEVMMTKFFYGGSQGEYKNSYGGDEDVSVEYKYLLSRRALVIPVLAKFTVRANDKISFGLFAGPHFTANIGKWEDYGWRKETYDDGETDIDEWIDFYKSDDKYYKDSYKIPPVGFTVGTNFGFMTNAGTFFVDVRFLSDIGNVKINNGEWENNKRKEDKWEDYVHRSKLAFSLGYEFGAGSR